MIVIYLVITYRQEGSLSSWLRQRSQAGSLAPPELAHFAGQVASALQHAHDWQIIHQDVNSANFLPRSEMPMCPDPLLADIGTAHFSTATSSASLSIRGTPTLMASEQWKGHPMPASYQYALAIMAYELLMGHPPFQSAPGPLMYQHLTVLAPPPRSENLRLWAGLDAVLLHALAKRPEQRFDSMMAFANTFRQTVQGKLAISAPIRTGVAPVPVPTPTPAGTGDLRAVLTISMEEAQVGTMHTLTLPGGRQVMVLLPAGRCPDGRGGISPASGAAGALMLSILVKTAEEPSPLASESAPVAENTVLTADPAAPATGVPIGNNKGQHPTESGAARPEMTVSPSPAVEPTKATTSASQVLPTATELALPRELSGGRPAETTLSNQLRQRAGVVSADRLSLLPAPITAQPQRDISRRAFMLRLAGLTVVSAAGSSLVLLACGQQPAAPASPTSLPRSTALYTYHGHAGAVYAVTWSPDGKRIASGGTDVTVQVWDATDGGHVFTYHGHSDVVEAVAWSPDGKRIASASDDSTVQVWVAT